MNFSEKEVDLVMEKLRRHAPVDEIGEFITAAQIAAKCDEEINEKIDIKIDAEKTEDISNGALFGAVEKTLQLLEMGFTESDISVAVDRFGNNSGACNGVQ